MMWENTFGVSILAAVCNNEGVENHFFVSLRGNGKLLFLLNMYQAVGNFFYVPTEGKHLQFISEYVPR